MNPYVLAGVLAGLLNIATYFAYIKGTIQNQIIPHRITFLLYSVLNLLFLINQISNKGGYSIVFPLSGTFLAASVFCLSIKKGIGGSTNFDKLVLAAALLLLVLRGLSHDARTTTILGVMVDFVATFPTVIKVYRMPRSEKYITWILSSMSAFVSILAIENHDYILYVFPAYVIAMNLTVMLVKKVSHSKQSKVVS
ncbi:MAG: hypothetical protein U0R17_06620 [Acidimicrobiia bacterium]